MRQHGTVSNNHINLSYMNTTSNIDELSIIQSQSLKNLPDEIWVPIKGFENTYQISNYSRVKRLKTYFLQKSRGTCTQCFF